MAPIKPPSDATNICNVIIDIHLNTLKTHHLPSRYDISSHSVQSALHALQVYQNSYLKQNPHNIIEDNKQLQNLHWAT